MSRLLASIALACSLLSITGSQNVGCTQPQPTASGNNCTVSLDLSPQDNDTFSTSLNVCGLNVETPLVNMTSVCYSQCPYMEALYLLINASAPQATLNFDPNYNEACNGSVSIDTTPPESANLALLWTNDSVPNGCHISAEQLLLGSVTLSMTASWNTSIDVCLTFLNPITNVSSAAGSSSCLHLPPPPILSYTPKPLPAQFISAPVAVANGVLTISYLSNITNAEVTIDPSMYRDGDTLTPSYPAVSGFKASYFPNGTLVITGQASPQVYTSLLKSILFASSATYSSPRLLTMKVCNALCCSQTVTMSVELVYYVITFYEMKLDHTEYLGNTRGDLSTLVYNNPNTTGLNITLVVRNSVLDGNKEFLYYSGGSNLTHFDTSTVSSLLIPNCLPTCISDLTSSTSYMNMAEEPSYYNQAAEVVVRDIFVQLLDVGGNVIAMAMLEVDIVPYDDHKPALFISTPCNSTDITTYRQKRHTSSKKPHWDFHHSPGPAKHSGDHAPEVTSASLVPKSNHAPCLWYIIVAFSANISAPPMAGLGTDLLLRPARLNADVVGVVWEDKHTLVVTVTGCWLFNFTGVVDLLFNPQGSCTDHTPCTAGVCFANGTGCPVRGLYEVKQGLSSNHTPSHFGPGLMVLYIQSMTVGVVITLLLVVWQLLKRRRRSGGYQVGEDGRPSVPKCPPQVAINITPPPLKQPSKKKPTRSNHTHCSHTTSSADPLLGPHSDHPSSTLEPCTLYPMSVGYTGEGPPTERGGGGDEEVVSAERWPTQLMEEMEASDATKDASQVQEVKPLLQEVKPHTLGTCREAGTNGEDLEVHQERLVSTVGALQSNGGGTGQSPSQPLTSPSNGHQVLHSSPRKHHTTTTIAANSHICSPANHHLT